MVQLKWIRGYVRIRVRGFGAERLINLCARRGICLWNIERQTDCISMCLSLKDFFSIRPLVRKSRTRVTVSERCGLPFFMMIVGKRKAFVIGLLMAVLFWMLSNVFVWDIRLGGNYSVSEDMFRSFLKTEGVTVGMKRRDLDIETLEKQIRRSFPQVTWASARLDGIRLSIEIKENDVLMEPETPEEETGADLVSPVEGRILSMIVREGIPMCKIGDTVQMHINGADYMATVINPTEIGIAEDSIGVNSDGEAQVYFKIDEEGLFLISEDVGSVTVLVEEKKDALYIPKHAGTTVDDKEIVYVENSDGIRSVKYVKTGLEADNKIEITD